MKFFSCLVPLKSVIDAGNRKTTKIITNLLPVMSSLLSKTEKNNSTVSECDDVTLNRSYIDLTEESPEKKILYNVVQTNLTPDFNPKIKLHHVGTSKVCEVKPENSLKFTPFRIKNSAASNKSTSSISSHQKLDSAILLDSSIDDILILSESQNTDNNVTGIKPENSSVICNDLDVVYEGSSEFIHLSNCRSSAPKQLIFQPKRKYHQDRIDKRKKRKDPRTQTINNIQVKAELEVSDSSEEEFDLSVPVKKGGFEPFRSGEHSWSAAVESTDKDEAEIDSSVSSSEKEEGELDSSVSSTDIADCVLKSSPVSELSTHLKESSLDQMKKSQPQSSASSLADPLTPMKPDLTGIQYHLPISDSVLYKRQTYERQRPWVATNHCQKSETTSKQCQFTLLSYNVLAPSIVPRTMFLYEKCDPRHLSWRYRWHLLQYEMRKVLPDIVALQEVDEKIYRSHFLPWMSYHGFDGLYKKRTGDKGDGCALFYRKDMFKLIESCSVEYCQEKGGRTLDRDNVGLIAKLSPLAFEQPFCVTTTHLLYNPNRHDVRLSQMALLLAELDRISYLGEEGGVTKYCPMVLTGDFNTFPQSALVQFLSKGRLNYHALEQQSAFRHHFQSQLVPPALGINERCQHSALQQPRYLERKRGQLFSLADKRKIEEDLIKLSHSDKKPVHQRAHASSSTNNIGQAQSLGNIYHNFNMASVYDILSDRLASTYHEQWINVDYIFYSGNDPKRTNDANLNLVSSYALPTPQTASTYGPLPSDICPSDHFPLAAKFNLITDNKDC